MLVALNKCFLYINLTCGHIKFIFVYVRVCVSFIIGTTLHGFVPNYNQQYKVNEKKPPKSKLELGLPIAFSAQITVTQHLFKFICHSSVGCRGAASPFITVLLLCEMTHCQSVDFNITLIYTLGGYIGIKISDVIKKCDEKTKRCHRASDFRWSSGFI